MKFHEQESSCQYDGQLERLKKLESRGRQGRQDLAFRRRVSDNLSENQRNKIINKMESLGEKIKDYPIYQDLLDDEMLRKNGGENNRDLSVN